MPWTVVPGTLGGNAALESTTPPSRDFLGGKIMSPKLNLDPGPLRCSEESLCGGNMAYMCVHFWLSKRSV